MSAQLDAPARFDGKRVAQWWRGASGAVGGPGDRATMAGLRHGRSPIEIALIEPFHRARNELGRMSGNDLERLALVLGVLAHAKTDDPDVRVAAALGGSGKPTMHPLRFQRLLQMEDRDSTALHAHGVRLVRLLRGRVNVEDLAWALYSWNEDTRLDWARIYYESIDFEEK